MDSESGLPPHVQGAADPGFSCVAQTFAKLFPGPRFGGGALSVYVDGEPVVDIWTGWSDRHGEKRWTADTGAMVFSASKGVASTVLHRLVDRGLLSYEAPIAQYWPEFGANGKSAITVRDMLRHRAGLSHLKGVSKSELLDHRLMEERIAAAPVDRLAGRGAYHAFTYGWLASGLARAITGMGMRELFRREIAQPLNTDGLHLGRPPVDAPTKVAQIMFPQNTRANPLIDHLAPRLAELPVAGGLGALYVPGLTSLVQGDIPFLDSEIPSVNAVVTARGLAKMYGALANDGRIDGKRFLSKELARGLLGTLSLRRPT
jgi:CubicO group peptidase (beta-lactamase class C family)